MTDKDIKAEFVPDPLKELRELRDRLDGCYDEDMLPWNLFHLFSSPSNERDTTSTAETVNAIRDQLTSAVEAWQYERDKRAMANASSRAWAASMAVRHTVRTQGPIERALREEWAKKGHGALGKTRENISRFAESLSDEDTTQVFGDTSSFIGDLIGSLLHELGEPQTVDESRLLPEGLSWPTYEDGTPVRIGDEVAGAGAMDGGCGTVHHVAFDADSWQLYARDDTLITYQSADDGHATRYVEPEPEPVLDHDGEPIEVGDTVWYETTRYTVAGLSPKGGYPCPHIDAAVMEPTGGRMGDIIAAWCLTHERPDTWGLLMDDVKRAIYCSQTYPSMHDAVNDAEEFIRRAKALAGDAK